MAWVLNNIDISDAITHPYADLALGMDKNLHLA